MAISMPGLGSGLDVNALISGLMTAERVPLDKVNAEKTQIQSASSSISAFSTKLAALQTAAVALSTPSGFSSVAATSSDPAIVASASGMGATGAYDLTVTALAREQRTYSNTQASSTAALGMAGTLSLAVGGNAAVNLTIDAGDSLTDIAAKISSSGTRTSASVLYDGGTYRLQVRGLDTGADNTVTFGETGFSLGLSTPANTYQTAQDAAVKIDGITVKRPTNQLNDVIPGVNLALTKTTTSPVTVRVQPDSTELQKKIQSFVSAYNDVVISGHVAAGYGSTKAVNSVLQGDQAIRTSLDRLGRVVASQVPGTTGRYTTLGSVGVSATNDGTLKLDSAKLSAALSADSASVARLFVTDASNGSTGVMATFNQTVTDLTGTNTSPVAARIEAFGSRTKRLSDRADDLQRRLDAYKAQLQAQYASLDSTVSKYKAFENALSLDDNKK